MPGNGNRHRAEDGEGKDGAYQELFPRGRGPGSVDKHGLC